jgi:Holliday junction resolvase
MSRGYGAQRGRDAEVRLAQHLEGLGWVVGSRRHIGGAGDLLAVEREDEHLLTTPVWLIEVKTTTDGPWKNCGPADRQALKDTAARVGAIPAVAWKPPRQKHWSWLLERDWPEATSTEDAT